MLKINMHLRLALKWTGRFWERICMQHTEWKKVWEPGLHKKRVQPFPSSTAPISLPGPPWIQCCSLHQLRESWPFQTPWTWNNGLWGSCLGWRISNIRGAESEWGRWARQKRSVTQWRWAKGILSCHGGGIQNLLSGQRETQPGSHMECGIQPRCRKELGTSDPHAYMLLPTSHTQKGFPKSWERRRGEAIIWDVFLW